MRRCELLALGLARLDLGSQIEGAIAALLHGSMHRVKFSGGTVQVGDWVVWVRNDHVASRSMT